ncbi:hypothetical protein A7U60_g6993 [Sanghuangporus baumii]|uniref:Elongation factor methyltransferase 7 n=1 Tax=Sanghuangporus baumii TaxID=108892 RepID=A0A9Q5N0S9_SANBA|nr:hypothetical protein A7U60_g6993 [Sanghuangporus baumii]
MADSDIEPGDLALESLFPEESRPPSPEPTVSTHIREKRTKPGDAKESDDIGKGVWSKIEIRLVGSHPLWGHYLWNAAKAFASYLDRHVKLYRGKNVLELGAGGGLPGLVTALNGSRRTVLTDYPDKALLENLEYNVGLNIPESCRDNVLVQGYTWGTSVDRLLEVAPEKYDLIILSDLVFNHSQHDALLKACELTLRNNSSDALPTVLVFYTHHRPHLASRDLEFFKKAEERGWTCKEIITERFPPMFPDDPGDETVRATVHGWALTR